MTQNHKKELFSKRLNIVRYALGFRDHKHFRSGAQNTGIDLGQGQFADLFRKYAERKWENFVVPEGWSKDEDIAKAVPTDTTITRWLRGESYPARKQLPGIVAVLNAILADARADDAFLTSKRAADELLIKPKFVFDVKNIDPVETAGRHFAEALGFAIAIYDNWWKDASGPLIESNLSPEERKFLGFYFAYRLYAEKSAIMQRDVLIVHQNDTRDGLRAKLIGSSDVPWEGDLVLGQSTVSVLLKRTGEIMGTQINAMSMAHRMGEDLMHGFRTRIVDGATFNIAAYRVVLLKSDDGEHAKYAEDDLSNPKVISELMGLSKAISEREEALESRLKLIRDALTAEQPELNGFELVERRSHNIFGLPNALISTAEKDADNPKTA